MSAAPNPTTIDVRDPIEIEVVRDVVESRHLVDAVIATADGANRVWGDVGASVIPRSAIKPVQVLPLLITGAAEAFSVSDIEVALGAASHSGQPDHVAAVAAWLDRLGFSAHQLECGADRPMHQPSADAVLATGDSFTPLHNCCSGKHAAFLTIARHLDVDPAGYIERQHPVQRLVTSAIEELTGTDLAGASNGIDGCGIPTFSLPLEGLAAAMARLVTPSALDSTTAAAAHRVAAAMTDHVWWVSGTNRDEQQLAAAASEPVLLKIGAEGVFVAILERRGLGIALKVRDGAPRAAASAMAGVLAHLGVVPPSAAIAPLTNKAGTPTGEIRPTKAS